MKITNIKKWLNDTNKHEKIINQPFYQDVEDGLIELIKSELLNMSTEEAINSLISEINYTERRKCFKNIKIADGKLDVKIGSICLIDFGRQYNLECSYVHPALVLSKSHKKLFTIPITSSKKQFQNASFWQYDNLVPFVYREYDKANIKKDSTLFLNDAKWINSSRIIACIGEIDVHSKEFEEIINRFFSLTKKGSEIFEKNLSWV